MAERRLYQRFQKKYTITFTVNDHPPRMYDTSTILDISRGGLFFISSVPHPVGTRIFFNIKFPFLLPQETSVDGQVIALEQTPGSRIFRIRGKFINVSPQAEAALLQMEEINLKNK
jgi:hypothetical protein